MAGAINQPVTSILYEKNMKTIILAGGVGGAKLVDGMAQIVPAQDLTVIVNTGDDFEHLGLKICPDIDTVIYTLADVANPDTGWGREHESWRTISEVEKLGGAAWFRLGDVDLATHLVRSQLLAEGQSLTEATQHLCHHLDITINVLPMSDQPAPTYIASEDDLLPFQNWFVERRWEPVVEEVRLPENVKTTPQIAAALEKADLVLIAPSNPFVSIDPILNVYPIRPMIADLPKLVLAVSPIIGGEAVKGPAAKMMRELGTEASAAAVADHYGDLLDVFVYDTQDPGPLNISQLNEFQTDTLMRDKKDRGRLAREILDYSLELLQS
jgi:LPPG:FO 2-phospho-L-lactate transferase